MFTYQEYMAGKVNFVNYFSQFTNDALEQEVASAIKALYSEYLGGSYVPSAIVLDFEGLGKFATKGDMPDHAMANVVKAVCRRIYMSVHNMAEK